MTFLNASLALAGVACVAIPILIHLLFRRRRKPVLWGAMRFVLEAYRKQRRRLRLEQILLLLARCLIVLLVALAIGRPALERAGILGGAGARSVYLLIDNGLASSARDEAGRTALDRHKQAAAEVLAALGGSDRAALIALGGPADPVVAPPSSNLAQVKSLIEALTPADSATDLAGALERVRAEIAQATGAGQRDTAIVVLSDFHTGSAETSTALPAVSRSGDEPGAQRVRLLASRPLQTGPTNVQVVAVDPLRLVSLRDATDAPAAEQVAVRLRRTGDGASRAGVTTVRAIAVGDGAGGAAPPAQQTVRWTPGQTEATVSLPVTMPPSAEGAAGASAAVGVEIDRDAVEGDNVFMRPVAVREELRVALIARRRFGGPLRIDRLDPADWLRLALRPSQTAPIETIDVEPAAIDTPTLAAVDAAIVTRPDLVESDGWTRLRRFVDAGGLLLVFPPSEASVHLWTDAFTSSMGLSWRIGRETREHEPAIGLSAEQPRTTILALVYDELKELVSPVRVTRTLPIESLPAGAETLMTFSTGEPFIVAQSPAESENESGAARAERGLVVFASSAPAWSWTDLPAKPLMLPLVQEIVRQGVGRAHGAWSAIAGGRVSASAAGRTVELRAVDAGRPGGGSETLTVDESGRTVAPVRRAGLFRAVDARAASRGLIAINADAAAGRTDAQAPSLVQAWLAPVAGPASFAWIEPTSSAGAGAPFVSGAGERGGSPFSLPLLIAALAIAFAEMWMARWFSHARVDQGAGASPASLAGVAS